MEKELIILTNYLDKIADKLGIAAGQLWPYMIKQQYVEALGSLFFFLLIGAGFLFTIKKMINHIDKQKDEPETYDVDGVLIVFIIINIAVGFLFVISVCCLPDIARIFNPEFYALKDIIKMLSSIK